MKKVTLTVPWGHIDPIVKIWNKYIVYYNFYNSYPANVENRVSS